MADKEKKVAKNSDVEKATTDESKAAAKVAKAAKGNTNKKDKQDTKVSHLSLVRVFIRN